MRVNKKGVRTMRAIGRLLIILFILLGGGVYAGFCADQGAREQRECLFFPVDQASRDGYAITNKDWLTLSHQDRITFVREGIKEIERKELVMISAQDSAELVSTIDPAMRLVAKMAPQTADPMYNVLYEILDSKGAVTPIEEK